MSTKHYFPSTAANTLVPRALRALVRAHPGSLVLDDAQRVVASTEHSPQHVSIVGGGGSGHEPAWSGFVGEGLLAAAACGDIFASPSTKQVRAAMALAPSVQGTILLITNYTGDRLHFGLAAEQERAAAAANVVLLYGSDDVSIGRTASARVGRRGMPGHLFTMKALGAAAAQGWSLDRCVALGRAVNAQTVSIGSSLDHCHVPGRQHQSIADDVCVLGAGIHNEPGQQLLTPFPPVSQLVARCLALLCAQDDPERAFVQFAAGDKVALLLNNYGGLSILELGALADEVQQQLEQVYGIVPCFTLTGALETSLNAPGFSVSLCNLSAVERAQTGDDSITADRLLALLERPTSAVSWPNTTRPPVAVQGQKATSTAGVNGHAATHNAQPFPALHVDVSLLQTAVRSACEGAIAAEPMLTAWDTVMGDGDCGEAVKGLCEGILGVLETQGAAGNVFSFLAALAAAVDDMGGTLGAILGILLSAFLTALRAAVQTAPSPPPSKPALFAACFASAVDTLQTYTPAREGDRTVMDVLIPFAAAYASGHGDLATAVRVAGDKAAATRLLPPRMGRASYVGEAVTSGRPTPPDPGAWAFYEMVWGLAKGLGLDVPKEAPGV